MGIEEENKTFRISHAVLGMLFLSIMIREVDINRLGSAAIWETAELVIRLGAVVVWLNLGALVFRIWMTWWRTRFPIRFSPTPGRTGQDAGPGSWLIAG